MKVALYPHETGSGSETYCRELAGELSGTDITPVAIGDTRPSNDDIEWVETQPVTTPVPLLRQRRAAARLSSALAGVDVDLLHLANPSILPFLDRTLPTVVTAWFHPPRFLAGLRTAYRSYPRLRSQMPLQVVRRGVLQLLDRRGYRQAAHTVAVTRELDEALRGHGYDASYVPPGISVDTAGTWEAPSSDDRDLLYVAASVSNARKNFPALLDIAERLRDGYDDGAVRVHVVGEHEAHQADRVRDRSLGGTVTLHGRVPREELFEMYVTHDCLLAPSRYEEFGYAVLEAMAHGLPVVGADIHAFRDLLGGDAGVLSDATSPEVFAADVAALLRDEDRQQRISTAAMDRVDQRYDWATVVTELRDLYADAVA